MDDSEQSILERRQLRHGYRSLLSDAAARKKEYLEDGGSLLLEDLDRANDLFSAVQGTAEGVLDSRFLVMSADIGARRAHMMRIDSAAFDSLEYVEKVREVLYGPGRSADEQQMAGTPPDWAAVGTVAARFSRQPPRLSYIFGPLMVAAKERRRAEGARRRDRASLSGTQQALIETMAEGDVKRQENQTTKLVQRVHRLMVQTGPVNLFRLVINPDSFAQSVENIFYVSFLIRDGKAYIDDSSGQPIIEACEPPQQEDYQSGLTKKQLIFALDQPTWRTIVDTYGIDRCLIPPRRSKRDDAGLSQISSQVPV
ncbi:hypothetical protein H4S08_001015 [Coemansia sp. RSA 1365]|nr:hypothetical protein H4S08_001015 [Coemansia sp. RSA 1365]